MCVYVSVRAFVGYTSATGATLAAEKWISTTSSVATLAISMTILVTHSCKHTSVGLLAAQQPTQFNYNMHDYSFCMLLFSSMLEQAQHLDLSDSSLERPPVFLPTPTSREHHKLSQAPDNREGQTKPRDRGLVSKFGSSVKPRVGPEGAGWDTMGWGAQALHHTYIHAHTHIHDIHDIHHTRVHAYSRTSVHKGTPTYTYTYTYTYPCPYTYTCTCIYICIYIHSYAHT